MDYEKKYNHALEVVRELQKDWASTQNRAAREIELAFPELRESEDERMRKLIIDRVRSATEVTESLRDLLLTYLERQKEHYMPAEEVLARAGLKPYKDGNQWCILAGDNIQEGICGFGDTIDEALYQFLMEVLEKKKEQNREDEEFTDFTIYHPLKNGKGKYECIPYSFYGSLTSFSEDKDLIDFLRTCFYTKEECNKWIEKQEEQEPAEWSEEDERKRNGLIKGLEDRMGFGWASDPFSREEYISWLKSLRPQPKQEWSEEDEKMFASISNLLWEGYGCFKENKIPTPEWSKIRNWLKSLRPQPHCKPSENQMSMLLAVINDPSNAGSESCHLALTSLYNYLNKQM